MRTYPVEMRTAAVTAYVAGEKPLSISRRIGVIVPTVKGWIRLAGKTRTRSEGNRVHTINPHAFDILTPTNAWALGVIFGDGCIVRRRGVIKGVDVAGDADVCRKIATIVESSAPVRKVRGCYYVRFNSPELATALGRYGLTPDKSRTMPFPDLPETLLPHFVRGFLDADGHVALHRGRYPTVGFASASRAFMGRLLVLVNGATGARRSLMAGRDGVFQIRVHCRKALTLAAWLWRGSSSGSRGDRKFTLAAALPGVSF